MRARVAVFICVITISLGLLIWRYESARHAGKAPASGADATPAQGEGASPASLAGPTEVYAHNLMLRKGPNFRVYVRWLRGEMVRTHKDVNPSFDDPDSFVLDIKAGVLRANMGDISNFLNSSLEKSPLTDIKLSGDGNQVKLSGTLHKVVPLPIELTGTISTVSNNRIQLHVTKLNVLKIPLKGLLGGLHIDVSDLFHPQNMPGVQVSGNDIFFDTQTLLPPPQMRGQLTSVRIVNPDLEEVYGSARDEVTRVEQWRNFLRLREGTIDFGKLTMRHVDLIMIDVSGDAWFDLDLTHYQEQLVNGYTRMTPTAGLQIFMPDLSTIPRNKSNQNIGIQWMKNRNLPPPPDVTPK